MKKIFFYILILMIITFAIPFLFTREAAESNKLVNLTSKGADVMQINDIKQNEKNYEKYDYKEYNTIKLLHTKNNSIEEIPIDEYLYGVVSAEMPVDYNIEALKAQAVVARTYTIYKIMQNQSKHKDADICDSSQCCQAWISKNDRLARWDENKQEENWNKIVQAVNETKGKVIKYEGKVIDAFFHSNSGGKTEVPVNVWGGTNYPYLQSVETAGEEGYSQYKSEVKLSKEDFENKIKEKHSDFQINYDEDDCIKITEYTDSGRVKTIKVGNLNLSGVEFRSLMELKSTNFEIELSENEITINVIGNGHGVGMSQTGANTLAKNGESCEEIIKHFYTGVEICNL